MNEGVVFAVLLVIFWLITPGALLLIGLVFESRRVPLNPLSGKQFFGFIPGDLFLAWGQASLVMAANPYMEHGASDGRDEPWLALLIVPLVFVSCAVAVMITIAEEQKYEGGPGYPKKALLSPTKLYHNIFLYGVLAPTNIVCLYMAIRNFEWSGYWLGFILGMTAWLSCVLADVFVPKIMAKKGIVLNPAPYAHVSDWKPIWKK